MNNHGAVPVRKGSQRFMLCAVRAWAGFLFVVLISLADFTYGFQLSWTLDSGTIQRYTLWNELRGIIEGFSSRSTSSCLSMSFLEGFRARFSPWRNIESSDVVYRIFDGASGGNRRFFDPPLPLASPLNRTLENLEVLTLNTSSIPLPEVRSGETKHGPWTAEDKKAFLLASLQSRNVLPPSQLSPAIQTKDNENVAAPASLPQHQLMSSFPSTSAGLDKEHEEHQKRAWVEMVLDPDRFYQIRSYAKNSTQVISCRISAKNMEEISQMESRYSPIVEKIEVGRTTSEFDIPGNLSPYLRNREAFNRMLQLRSSFLKDEKSAGKVKPHKTLDGMSDEVGHRKLPATSNLSTAQSTSEEDLLKTRSVIRQFHLPLTSVPQTIGKVKPVLQSQVLMLNENVARPQNVITMKERRKAIDRIPPKSIRMKLPIADDDGVDAQGNRTLSLQLRDVIQQASFASLTESQVDRSKKWGIDMSKFT
jgi:hypothetical protein